MQNRVDTIWKNFQTYHQLTDHQLDQFKIYYQRLIEWSKKTNITAITDFESIIQDHFSDSLALLHHYDMNRVSGLADIGSGGGFPGLPLKLKFPDMPVVLIEVNNKKIAFLEHVIQELGMQSIEVCPVDWRTFLRKTEYDIDLFCARASLSIEQLLHLFKPSCRYNRSTLVYWASNKWSVERDHEPFMSHTVSYDLSGKSRKLVFFKAHYLDAASEIR